MLLIPNRYRAFPAACFLFPLICFCCRKLQWKSVTWVKTGFILEGFYIHIWWTLNAPFCAYYPQTDGGTKYNSLIDFVAGGGFLYHCRNAGRRVRRARWQPPCHRLLERFLLDDPVHPVPVPVCTARRAQGHLWCPAHLLSLCDVRPALHLPPVDHWAECEQ